MKALHITARADYDVCLEQCDSIREAEKALDGFSLLTVTATARRDWRARIIASQ